MEISVISTAGVPDGSIISIRSGATRRQGVLSTGKPFHFPQHASASDCIIKVEVMQTIGSGFVVMRPNQNDGKRYDMALAGSGTNMACGISVAPVANGHAASVQGTSANDADAKQQAAAYLQSTGLLAFVQAVLQVIASEQPKDPYVAMAKHFLSASDQSPKVVLQSTGRAECEHIDEPQDPISNFMATVPNTDEFWEGPAAPEAFLRLLQEMPDFFSRHHALNGRSLMDIISGVSAKSPLRNSRDVITSFMQQNWTHGSLMGEQLSSDRDFMLAYDALVPDFIERGCMSWASASLRANNDFVREVLRRHPEALAGAAPELWYDQELVYMALSSAPRVLQFAPMEVRQNQQLVLLAVQKAAYAVDHAADNMRGDRDIMFAAISQYASYFEKASAELRNDRELFLMSCMEGRGNYPSWENFRFAGDVIRQDREMNIHAVRVCGLSIAHEAFRADRDVVLTALQAAVPKGIELIDPRLLYVDQEVLLQALEVCGRTGQSLPGLADGSLLAQLHESLQHNREVVLAVVSRSHLALNNAAPCFQTDLEICTAAKLNHFALPAALEGITPNLAGELGRAAYAGDVHKARELIQAGASPIKPISAGRIEGVAPLHLAAAGGSVECVQLLLAAGATPSDSFARLEIELDPAGLQYYTRQPFYPHDVAASNDVLAALGAGNAWDQH